MRTTLTLNEDVAIKAKKLAKKMDLSFKQVINTALQKGLQLMEEPEQYRPYCTRPHALGLRPGLSLDNVQELLAQMEKEDFK